MTTILLVDDHQLVRAGLAGLLDGADDLQVVRQAADGQQALQLAADLAPDVVLMDLSMPVLDGVEATRRLLAAHPAAKVVVLTSFSDQPRVADALAAGAVGYLLKDCEPRDLMAAVRAAAQGHAPLDPRVARTLLPGAEPAHPADELSAREQQVLRLVTKGLANKQIAVPGHQPVHRESPHQQRVPAHWRGRPHQRCHLGPGAPPRPAEHRVSQPRHLVSCA